MKILMVCLGNICRSPLAEGILKEKSKIAGLNWQIESAGTNGFHTGEPPHQLSQKVASLHGIDIGGQRARRFIESDLEQYNRIYAMANDVLSDIEAISGKNTHSAKVELFLNELYPAKNMDVPDPWYGPEKGYYEVYSLIEQTCDALINNYMISKNQTQHSNA